MQQEAACALVTGNSNSPSFSRREPVVNRLQPFSTKRCGNSEPIPGRAPGGRILSGAPGCEDYASWCLLCHPLSFAMVDEAAQHERAGDEEDRCTLRSEKTWYLRYLSCIRRADPGVGTNLSDGGFCMKAFSLCRVLADGNGAETLQRMEATIGREIRRTSDKVEADQAWWLDARSLL